jgi:hypothetical protein
MAQNPEIEGATNTVPKQTEVAAQTAEVTPAATQKTVSTNPRIQKAMDVYDAITAANKP